MNWLKKDPHQKLVDACRTGDRKAQKELYGHYAKAMFNLANRMLYVETDAEDVLQEAFLDAFTKIDQFKGRSTFGAWLKRIVINKCVDQMKKRKNILVDPDDKMWKQLETTDEEVFYQVNALDIENAMKKLPHGCRLVFNLYMIEGYDHQEISEINGISLSTSKSQLSRAKQLLKEQLKKKIYV